MVDITTVVGIIAGVCTSASLLPQLFKMIKEKKATDISVVMLVILLTGLALWIWYGILREDLPVILTNSFSTLVNILILLLRYYYTRQKAKN